LESDALNALEEAERQVEDTLIAEGCVDLTGRRVPHDLIDGAATDVDAPADEYVPGSIHAERVHEVGGKTRRYGQVVIALSIGPGRRVEGARAGQSGDDVLRAGVTVRVRPRHDDLAAG
jgi:hypothetical protein